MLYIYKASAGSGKTYTLAREFIRLLLRMGADSYRPHSHILAATFTKKATAEMKQRILNELYTLAQDPKQSPYMQDAEFLKDINISEHELQQRAQQLLFGILQDYSGFAVNTIDGFFQQVLRAFAHELGLPAQYELTLDDKQVATQAIDDIIYKLNTKELNQDASEWITNIVVENIDNNQTWNPRQQMLHFSPALLSEELQVELSNARQILNDKNKLKQYKTTLIQIRQSFLKQLKDNLKQGQTLIERFNGVEGMNSNIRNVFYKPIDKVIESLGKTFCQAVEGEKKYWKTTTRGDALKQVQDALAAGLEECCKNLYNLCSADNICQYNTATLILQDFNQVGLLSDISEQIHLTNRLQNRLPISEVNTYINRIIDNSDAPFIYEKLGERIKHYMLDEFQDTSTMQWANFYPLLLNSNSQGYQNLIVGDIKQSIYRWRNSDWSILANVDKQIIPNCLPPMDTNFRSSGVIVNFNNSFFEKYCQTIVQTLDTNLGHKYSQQVRDAYSTLFQKAKKQETDGYVQIKVLEERNEEQVLVEMLDVINNLQTRGLSMGKVAILVRNKKATANICYYLTKAGLPVQSAEGLRIDANPVISLLIDMLSAGQNPKDDILDKRIRLTILQHIYPNDYQLAIDKTLQGEEVFTDEQKRAITQAALMPLYEHTQALIDILELSLWPQATTYLSAFLELVYNFTIQKTADVSAFLEYWQQVGCEKSIPAPNTENAIQVMTIHKSKGLEFEAVLIPFMDWDYADSTQDHRSVKWYKPQVEPFNMMPIVSVTFKHNLQQSIFKDQYQQEILNLYLDNLNLTYVALTRPKRELYAWSEPQKKNSKTTMKYLLAQLLQDQLNDGVFCIGNPNIQYTSTTSTENISTLKYHSIPIGERLRLSTRSIKDDEEPLSPIELGTIMHEFLSRINTLDNTDQELQKMIAEGKIGKNQTPQIENLIARFKQLVAPTNWFGQDNQEIICEQDIIASNGQIYRPDRIIINNKHATVIDYKFGQEHKTKYSDQVKLYIDLLQQMGYTANGYLVYVMLNKIKQV